MKRYKINEIFYSLQGEGYFAGTPSLFIRFSGCNLHCPFCDTAHEAGRSLSLSDILDEAAACPATHVVLTGGEPSLFVGQEIIDGLHALGKFIAIETNGTHALPEGIDWVTLSPKTPFVPGAPPVVLHSCDELKLIFDGRPVPEFRGLSVSHRFVQPCDTGDDAHNAVITAAAIAYCLQHPTWRLSLQTHKLTGIR